MKKIFFSLVAVCTMLLCSCSSNGLEGTWKADAKEIMGSSMEDFDKCEVLFTFDDDKVKLSFDLSGTTGQPNMTMDLGVAVDVEGTYEQKDDTLKLDFTDSNPQVDLYKFKVQADDATKKILESMGMDEKTMKDQFIKQMEGNNFAEAFGKDSKLVVKSLEGDKLVLESDGKEVHFTRE